MERRRVVKWPSTGSAAVGIGRLYRWIAEGGSSFVIPRPRDGLDWLRGGQRGPQGIGRLERGETCGHL